MQKKLTSKAIILLIVSAVLFMYQESPAQKKAPKPAKPATVEVKPVMPDIAFKVSMTKPSTHYLEVEMTLNWTQMPKSVELKMPVWTPGSYLVREYARHLQDFQARDASGGELAWTKTSKNTWQVETKGNGQIVVSYRVYANELTVRTNELNDEHAFWNNSALLLFVKDQLAAPATVTVMRYGDWKVATGLPRVAGQTNTFRAPNFDVLYDSPFEVSNFKEINFTVQGKPHRYVITGEGNYDPKKLVADTTKIIEETYKIFGELPYDDYTFILNLRGGGGLEHVNSTALQFNRFGFKPKARYDGFLGLVAHEYFHAFNVKRIKPDALGPFDYENENYTKLLWVAEGGTEYYSNILLRRAGIISENDFLSGRASGIQQLQERPGRLEQSLEYSSFDAWIKYYRPDENAINNQISYYDKGEIVNMMLDITIRTASGGTKSLDDVLRHLYNEFYKKGKNYTPTDFQKIAEMMAGKSLDDFFAKYVRGTAEIDYSSIVSGIGLKMNERQTGSGRAYIGADTAEENGRVTVRSIPAGSPAYEQGLNTGDQIIAIDGYRATQNFIQSYIGDKKPGDKVTFTIFRFDKLREVPFTLGGNMRKDYSFASVDAPTDLQKQLYRDYLNAELK
ncbi:MAG: M61 family metallopeptidase [Pyrinomonadaceae bacterium]|nr:M61 family metallopeptidase [Pyrinomonadaceae bacterium]MBP6211574.1 M61 family metallopeptidase [Pyrinomonadaceae bacterium]